MFLWNPCTLFACVSTIGAGVGRYSYIAIVAWAVIRFGHLEGLDGVILAQFPTVFAVVEDWAGGGFERFFDLRRSPFSRRMYIRRRRSSFLSFF